MGRIFNRRSKELKTIFLTPSQQQFYEDESRIGGTASASPSNTNATTSTTTSTTGSNYLESKRCATTVKEPAVDLLHHNVKCYDVDDNKYEYSEDDIPTNELMRRAGCFPKKSAVKITQPRNVVPGNSVNNSILMNTNSKPDLSTSTTNSDENNSSIESNIPVYGKRNTLVTSCGATEVDTGTILKERESNMDDEPLLLFHEMGNTSCLPKRRRLHSLRSSKQQHQQQLHRRQMNQSSSLTSDLEGNGIGMIRTQVVVNSEYEMELLSSKYRPASSLTKPHDIRSQYELLEEEEEDDNDNDNDLNNKDEAEDECTIVSFIEPQPLHTEETPTPTTTTANSTSIYSQYDWFPSSVCLSTLQNDRYFDNGSEDSTTLPRTTKSAFIKYFVPVPQCIVQNSCLRHLRGYAHVVSNKISATSATKSTTKKKETGTSSFDNIKNKDMSSTILHEPNTARNVIMDFIQNNNFNGAMIVATNLLHHYQSNSKQQQDQQLPLHTTTATTDQIIVSLYGQMILFCLAMGRNGEALRYSSEALQRLKQLQQRQQQQQEVWPEDMQRHNTTNAAAAKPQHHLNHNSVSNQLVDTLLRHSLVLFSINKVSQAKKSLREALHTAIAKNGCIDSMVSVLLCNIGVIHLECGHNVKSSIRSFEESLVAQKALLKDGINICHNDYTPDIAMYQFAISLSNLAIAYERIGEIDRTITLLEESINVLYSIDGYLSDTDIQIAKKYLSRLAAQQQDNDKKFDVTVFNSSIESDNGLNLGCQFLFDKDGGLDKFIKSSHPFDDSDDYYSSETDVDDSDMNGYDSERSMILFGNSDGLPSFRVYPRVWLEESDNHDFLLLGQLVPELSVEQRVYESVKVWSGKQCNKNNDTATSTNFLSSSPMTKTIEGQQDKCNGGSPFCKEDLMYKLNFHGKTVLDADLHLNEIHKHAMICLDENQIDAAITVLYGAVQSHRAKYGEKHHLVGSALHNIGMVLFYAQRYSDALTVIENAVLIRDEALSSQHPDVHSSLLKIALLHIAMGNTHQAYDLLMDLLDTLSRSISDINNVNANNGCTRVYDIIQLAKVNNNIGVLAYEFGDLVHALESFKAAYNHQREVYQQYKMIDKNNYLQHDNSDVDDHHDDINGHFGTGTSGSWKILKLARLNTLCNMAFIYVKMGDKERGLELYDKAYSIMVGLVPAHHPTIQCTLSNIDVLVEAIYHNVRLKKDNTP